jgi:hypothetical protein
MNQVKFGLLLMALGICWALWGASVALFSDPANYTVRLCCGCIWFGPPVLGLLGGLIVIRSAK